MSARRSPATLPNPIFRFMPALQGVTTKDYERAHHAGSVEGNLPLYQADT
jgi:hypothetical protein